MRSRAIAAAAACVVAVLTVASPASAHVTANPSEAPASGFFTTFFRVGHGCEGKSPDTTRVSVSIPEGVLTAGPEDEPGWDAEVKMEKLDEPIEGAHGEITEVPSEVIWTTTGPPLDTHQFREFGISLQLAAEGQEVLWFPTVQKCEKGSLRWVNIPDSVEEWGDTEDPAPYLQIAAEEEEAAEETADAGMSEDDVRAIAASEASAVETDSDTDPMVWVALVLGAIGFLLGAGAFVRSGKRT